MPFQFPPNSDSFVLSLHTTSICPTLLLSSTALSSVSQCFCTLLLYQSALPNFETSFDEIVNDPTFAVLVKKSVLGDSLRRRVHIYHLARTRVRTRLRTVWTWLSICSPSGFLPSNLLSTRSSMKACEPISNEIPTLIGQNSHFDLAIALVWPLLFAQVKIG